MKLRIELAITSGAEAPKAGRKPAEPKNRRKKPNNLVRRGVFGLSFAYAMLDRFGLWDWLDRLKDLFF